MIDFATFSHGAPTLEAATTYAANEASEFALKTSIQPRHVVSVTTTTTHTPESDINETWYTHTITLCYCMWVEVEE